MNKKNIAFVGKINSLIISFKPSAIGCKTPQNPIILGPKRRCIEAIILRSANVKNATLIITGTNVKILIIKFKIILYNCILNIFVTMCSI